MNRSKKYNSPLLVNPFSIHFDTNGVTYLVLSDEMKHTLEELYSYRGYIAKDEEAHLATIRHKLYNCLDHNTLEIFARLASGRLGLGVVVIENLPFEPVDWSPVSGLPPHTAKPTSLSEHLLLGLASLFGEPYGVAKEGSRLVNELIPSRKALNLLTGEGSRKPLGLHTENAALRFAKPGLNWSPKGLLLNGVSAQGHGGPLTNVAIASQACSLLPEDAYNVLRSLCTYIALPLRQRQDENALQEVGPVPTILGAKGHEEVIAAFYGDMMRPVNEKAKWALMLLEEALQEVSFGIPITPGTLIYLANGPVLHGRSYFDPVFDGLGRAQRWLQRVFVTDRIEAFNECESISDRVFDIHL